MLKNKSQFIKHNFKHPFTLISYVVCSASSDKPSNIVFESYNFVISMYSLTQTGVHLFHHSDNNEPQVKMLCKCDRAILQEQIFTCLACSAYSCHYCTVPQFSSYQCRSCKRMSQSSIKNSKCPFCFSCPYCHSVLTLTKDPKTKCWIYLCQFCYWNTKEINMKEERAQILQDNLFKLSSLRECQNKIYNTAQSFFKETNIAIQMENQSYKYTHNKRPSIRSSLEESSVKDKQQLKKINEVLDTVVKHVGLDDDNEEYTAVEQKYPQALPLLTKKTRRCPECSKPVTNIYRPLVSGEPSVELMHKDLKVLQCQRLPAIDGKVKLKFLKNCVFQEKKYKIGEIIEIEISSPFEVVAMIENKRKNAEVTYKFKIEPYQKKK